LVQAQSPGPQSALLLALCVARSGTMQLEKPSGGSVDLMGLDPKRQRRAAVPASPIPPAAPSSAALAIVKYFQEVVLDG
jgi:hypothetical protein